MLFEDEWKDEQRGRAGTRVLVRKLDVADRPVDRQEIEIPIKTNDIRGLFIADNFPDIYRVLPAGLSA